MQFSYFAFPVLHRKATDTKHIFEIAARHSFAYNNPKNAHNFPHINRLALIKRRAHFSHTHKVQQIDRDCKLLCSKYNNDSSGFTVMPCIKFEYDSVGKKSSIWKVFKSIVKSLSKRRTRWLGKRVKFEKLKFIFRGRFMCWKCIFFYHWSGFVRLPVPHTR